MCLFCPRCLISSGTDVPMALLFQFCCDILLDLKVHEVLTLLPMAADPQMLMLIKAYWAVGRGCLDP